MICIFKKIALFLFIVFAIQTKAYATEPKVSARAAICVDAETFGIIFEKNADEKLSMASTTKIITAITAIENGNINDIVTVSANAAGTEGSSIWLGTGEKLTLSELLYALMLESGNDAAVAIAEHISGSEEAFSQLMNETCRKIGAFSTNCVTASGLDDENHYTTARDLALISRYAMHNDEFKKIVSTKAYTIPWQGKEWGRALENHNKLLRSYEGAVGIKTGYTKKSGRCLVSAAKRGELETIVVTLSDPDDWNDHKKMLDYSFEQYKNIKNILRKGNIAGSIEVAGSNDRVSYSPDESLSLRECKEPLCVTLKYNIEDKIDAPVKKGDILGSVDVYNEGIYITTVNLSATDDAEKNDLSYAYRERYVFLIKTLLELMR